MTTDSREYIDVVDTAKLVRKHLRSRFPTTTFSVRSDRYSGGSSIRVKYEDGPPVAELKDVTSLYTGATFDGMRDLMEYHDSFLTDDEGSTRRVHFGADFIFVDRSFSVAALTEAAERAARRWGVEVPEINPPTEFNGARMASPLPEIDYGRDFRFVVHEILENTDLSEEVPLS